MKLQFEHSLDYQLAAINAVCDLFAGLEICRTEFTVTALRSSYASIGARADAQGSQGTIGPSALGPGMPGDGVQPYRLATP